MVTPGVVACAYDNTPGRMGISGSVLRGVVFALSLTILTHSGMYVKLLVISVLRIGGVVGLVSGIGDDVGLTLEELLEDS